MDGDKANYVLLKYAYYAGENQHPNTSDWKVYNGDVKELRLSITESHHLLVTYDKEILENMSLWNSSSWMKGITKGDSMLLISKHKDKNRRFRVKFQCKSDISGEEIRKQCVQKLANYFSVNMFDGTPVAGPEQIQSHVNCGELQGEVSVGKLAQVLSGKLKADLPGIYSDTPIPTESLENLITLCITDSNFPAFVVEVEKVLNKITEK